MSCCHLVHFALGGCHSVFYTKMLYYMYECCISHADTMSLPVPILNRATTVIRKICLVLTFDLPPLLHLIEFKVNKVHVELEMHLEKIYCKCNLCNLSSECHGYGYTCGFHMGLAVGTGTGTRLLTRQKPVPIPIPVIVMSHRDTTEYGWHARTSFASLLPPPQIQVSYV